MSSGEAVPGKAPLRESRVININRVAKVVKGGRRFSFTALVVVGDGAGRVGLGYGKAKEVPLAIQKGTEDAKRNLFRVPLAGNTIIHPVIGRWGAGQVMLRPASEGTGVIAGGAARVILEEAGIHDVLCKSLGSPNYINMARSAIAGLKALKRPDEVAELRGLYPEDFVPAPLWQSYQESEKDFVAGVAANEQAAAEGAAGEAAEGAVAGTSAGEPAGAPAGGTAGEVAASSDTAASAVVEDAAPATEKVTSYTAEPTADPGVSETTEPAQESN